MPINPRKTRSCSTRSSTSSRSNASFGSERKATPSVRSASPASSSFICKISARRSAVSGLISSPTSSCEQRASSTSGAPLVKTSRRSCRSASRMNRAHQLALGREGHFRDAREACVERFILQPGFARRDDQRPFGRVALHRPAPVALLQARRCWRGRRRRAHAPARPGARRRSPRRPSRRTSPSGA